MAIWIPWRGSRKYTEGCRHCYVDKSDPSRKFAPPTNKFIKREELVKTEDFNAPIAYKKNGDPKIPPNSMVYVCPQSDFLIEEADQWRQECWKMIKQRKDVDFLFLTKRPQRFMSCTPPDWGDGYDNVIIGCVIKDQTTADERLTVFDKLPIKHKDIIAQPFLERINIDKHLKGISLVIIGGGANGDRPLKSDWVVDLREQSHKRNVAFQFRSTGTRLMEYGNPAKRTARELPAECFNTHEDPFD